jgi:hypothetical protein
MDDNLLSHMRQQIVDWVLCDWLRKLDSRLQLLPVPVTFCLNAAGQHEFNEEKAGFESAGIAD